MKKINQALINIQNELKAPKSQRNTFGKYNYRNAEDILTAAKPINIKHKAVLTLSDDIILIGDRYYVKATAILESLEDDSIKEVTALARESEIKKGMDSAQITGSASSYARKYALNGLYNIDDTKDADFNNTTKEYSAAPQTEEQLRVIQLNTQAKLDKKQLGAKLLIEASNDKELAGATIESTLAHFGIKDWKSLDLTDIPMAAFIDKFSELVKIANQIKKENL